MPNPDNDEAWLEVSQQRLGEARVLARVNACEVGSVYLAGYAVECALKAYLMSHGRRRPPGGPGGHDLRSLWSSCRFALADLQDQSGETSYFVEHWCTDLRYQSVINSSHSATELLSGAQRLVGLVTTRCRRRASKRRRG